MRLKNFFGDGQHFLKIFLDPPDGNWHHDSCLLSTKFHFLRCFVQYLLIEHEQSRVRMGLDRLF